MSEIIIATNETARQTYFLNMYINHSLPVLFVGPTGTGESAITNSYLVSLPKETYYTHVAYYIHCIFIYIHVYTCTYPVMQSYTRDANSEMQLLLQMQFYLPYKFIIKI